MHFSCTSLAISTDGVKKMPEFFIRDWSVDKFEGRRLALLKLPIECFADLLKQDGSYLVEVLGMPADAKIDAVHHHKEHNQLWIRLESEDFPVYSPSSTSEIQLEFQQKALNEIDDGVMAMYGWVRFDSKEAEDDLSLKEVNQLLDYNIGVDLGWPIGSKDINGDIIECMPDIPAEVPVFKHDKKDPCWLDQPMGAGTVASTLCGFPVVFSEKVTNKHDGDPKQEFVMGNVDSFILSRAISKEEIDKLYNGWHNIVATYDEGESKTFVDGVEISNKPFPNDPDWAKAILETKPEIKSECSCLTQDLMIRGCRCGFLKKE